MNKEYLIGVGCSLDKNGFRLIQTSPKTIQGEDTENYYYHKLCKLNGYLPKSYINDIRVFNYFDNETLQVEAKCWFLNKVTKKDILGIKKRLLNEFNNTKKRIITNLTITHK